ncbi:MAG: hypothetical protein HS111_02130 [Kofleriaceae bacterium]|nr:hypothetical protein [Kofleriaceae bacterium]MCL4223015.1 hypothetical protein [Myxococcales bacterium]
MIARTWTAAALVVAWTALAVALAVAALACGHAPRGQPLMDAVRTYNDGVRWERFTAAAAAVPPAERDAFLDEREALARDLRISDYEVVRVKHEDRGADVQVKLTWYRDSEGTVRETWARQRWERQGKAWRIVAERVVRGHDMPGLDPADPAP